MNKLLVVTVLVALLALSSESFRVVRQTEVEQGALTKLTDTFKSYYDRSINTASGYLDDIKGLKLEEKAKNLYSETTKAVGTYFDIIQDQVYYIFYPQQ